MSISIAQAHLELCAVLRSIATGAAGSRDGMVLNEFRVHKLRLKLLHDLHDPCIPMVPFFGFLTFQRPGYQHISTLTVYRSGPNLYFRCGMLVGAVIVCCPC